MKALVFLVGGILFLGLLFGVRAFGEDPGRQAVFQEVEAPKARVLPGHPFYHLKEFGRTAREFLSFGDVARAQSHIRSLRERLAEFYGVLESKNNQAALENIEDAYREDLGIISKNIGVSEKKADAVFEELLDSSFYHAEVLKGMKRKFPKSAEALSSLEEEVVATLVNIVDYVSDDVSFDFSGFRENPLPALGFLDRVARRVLALEKKARILSFQSELTSDLKGRYLAGEFRSGAILEFFSQKKEDAFTKVRILDILRDAFREDELGNQLQFLRQEMLKNPETWVGFDPNIAATEIQNIKAVLDAFSNSKNIPKHLEAKLSDAKFTYDRALEFYSSGFLERSLAQTSLSMSSLNDFLSDYFLSEESAKKEAEALRERFDALKKNLAKRKQKLDSRADSFFSEAEKGIAELLVKAGQGGSESSSLFFRVRAFVIALEEIL